LTPAPIDFPAAGLSDGVVRLRLMAEADIPAIVEAVQDPEIPRWTRVPDPYGEEEARHWQRMATTGYDAGTELATLVVGADDGRLVGAMGLHNLDPASGRCSAGYWIAAPERGRGYAARALSLLCEFAFEELEAKRIELWIEPANAASLRVAEAVGFRREGLLRSFMPIGESRRDMLMYSLLPEDLRRGADRSPRR
jgi:[ribosomal protein S5]-alanine N-acetyltransferase